MIDRKDNLWFQVQTPERYWTLARYNFHNKTLVTYLNDFYGIPCRYLKFIAELPNGHLLVQNGKEIIDFNPETEQARVRLRNVPGMDKKDGRIFAMGRYKPLNDSLVYVDPNLIINVNDWSIFAQMREELALPDDVFQTSRSRYGGYWLDLQGRGRMRYEITSTGLTPIDDPNHLTVPHLALEGEKNQFYTFQYGLIQTDLESGTKQYFNYDHGIAEDIEAMMTLDGEGRIWAFHSCCPI